VKKSSLQKPTQNKRSKKGMKKKKKKKKNSRVNTAPMSLRKDAATEKEKTQQAPKESTHAGSSPKSRAQRPRRFKRLPIGRFPAWRAPVDGIKGGAVSASANGFPGSGNCAQCDSCRWRETAERPPQITGGQKFCLALVRWRFERMVAAGC